MYIIAGERAKYMFQNWLNMGPNLSSYIDKAEVSKDKTKNLKA